MTQVETQPDLQALIDWSRTRPSRMGYFAALYYQVGIVTEQAVKDGRFEHPDELLKVKELFFARYREAFVAFRDGQVAKGPWEAAFRTTDSSDLCVLQHLLLGINVHINYDLAIAVSDAIDPEDLPAFRGDFETMNAILGSLVNTMAADLALVFRPLGIVNRLFRREDALLIDAVIRLSREAAWRQALRLSRLQGAEREAAVAGLEREVSKVAEVIIERRTPIRLIMLLIHRMERGSITQIIDDLMRR